MQIDALNAGVPERPQLVDDARRGADEWAVEEGIELLAPRGLTVGFAGEGAVLRSRLIEECGRLAGEVSPGTR